MMNKDQEGFPLVEILISPVIFGTLGAGIIRALEAGAFFFAPGIFAIMLPLLWKGFQVYLNVHSRRQHHPKEGEDITRFVYR